MKTPDEIRFINQQLKGIYMLSVNHNSTALRVSHIIGTTSNKISQTSERLSTGLRINSAKDDAAGLAISQRMESQIRGMTVASRNVNDAVSLVQTAEGAMGTGTNILQKMRELATSSSNGAMSDADRANLDKEYQALSSELTRLYDTTSFNGQKIVGADAGTFSFQIGANSGETLDVTTIQGSSLLATPGDLKSAANAATAISALDTAISNTSSARADLGAAMNRLDYVADNLANSITNASDAKSRITDADYATEVSNLTKNQVLQQAGTAMLAQANQQPQMILSLLRG